MKTVAFYNNKGGVGKTTLAVHFALFAELLKLHVLAVCLDRQGDMLRWISDGAASAGEAGVFKKSEFLSAIYSPMSIPKIKSGIDLLIADCPPAVQIAAEIDPSIWIIPILGRLGFENLFTILDDLRDSKAEVIVLMNRKGGGGKRQEKKMHEALSKIKRVTYYEPGIRQANAVSRVTNEFSAVWDDTFAKGVRADLENFCRFLLKRCGLRSR
ncbi:MAG: ParA family protein [Myxococcales bacterium]|nr:ParA family protein [Myxococcales bacterium]MCB9756472.1 ParA family protein [Myxococcales bacterium]